MQKVPYLDRFPLVGPAAYVVKCPGGGEATFVERKPDHAAYMIADHLDGDLATIRSAVAHAVRSGSATFTFPDGDVQYVLEVPWATVRARPAALVEPGKGLVSAYAQQVEPAQITGLIEADKWIWRVELVLPGTADCVRHALFLTQTAEDRLRAADYERAWSAVEALASHLYYWRALHRTGRVALRLDPEQVDALNRTLGIGLPDNRTVFLHFVRKMAEFRGAVWRRLWRD